MGDLVGVMGLEKQGVTGPGEAGDSVPPRACIVCNTSGLGLVCLGDKLGVRTSKSSYSESEASPVSVCGWKRSSQAVHSPWPGEHGSGHM